MATEPRWVRHPHTAVPIPIDKITDMVTLRLQDAQVYFDETKAELDHTKRTLEARLAVYEGAKEQLDYWKRILTAIKEYDE